jgi:SAM-dependent methyltransferase
MERDERAITLGHPSYVWREGQERRLALVRQYAPLEQARILDAGCGLGLYVQRFMAFSARVHGVDIDADKVRQARALGASVLAASAEALPYQDGCFDVLFSHEVLEHVPDDRAAVREAYRVLRPGGRMVIFAPNRLYPFETHGYYWRGRYHFGNIPLINYLPDCLRERLCPHVRAYTQAGLLRLFDDLDGRVIVARRIYAGYDNIVARWPRLGRLLRRTTYALEGTPLQAFGLSHLVVFEKASGEQS